jgi:hypothetical protein
VGRIYKSGAFAQQCFAMHPLCLGIKKVAPDLIVLLCTSCHLQHHFKVRHVTSQLSQTVTEGTVQEHQGEAAQEDLARCARTHPVALRVGAMDVVEDRIGLRCAECRMAFAMDLASCETHEK